MTAAAALMEASARELLEAPTRDAGRSGSGRLSRPTGGGAVDPSALAAGLTARPARATTTRQRGRTGNVQWSESAHPRGQGGRFTVSHAQQSLKEHGHDPGKVDGQHGPKTTAALKAFQTKYGLKPTGTLNAETSATLAAPPPRTAAQAKAETDKMIAASKPKTTTAGSKGKSRAGGSARSSSSPGGGTSGSTSTQGGAWQGNLSPTGVLRAGHGTKTKAGADATRGNREVKLLQAKLVALGFDLGAAGQDGKYGTATTKAVKAFQRAYGLKPDGVVGRHTKMMLNLLGLAEQTRGKNPDALSIDQMQLSTAGKASASAAADQLRGSL